MGHDSGAKKRKRKEKERTLIQSQKGAMDKFIIKETKASSDNQSVGPSTLALDIIPYNDDTDGHTETENNVEVDEDGIDVDLNASPAADVDDSFQPDIFDPRSWNSLDSKQIDILAQRGPRRDLKIKKGLKDRFKRRFSAVYYTRLLSNGEHCDRDWLVYSKELDRVFCFGCKLFTKGHRKGQLANEGCNDWSHIVTRLQDHERSVEHVLNMTNWYELRSRLEKHQTIDKAAQRQFEKEKDHWGKVLFRIVCIVKFLAKHNLAFRGSNSKLYEDSNGNFLGLIEMLAEFDPVIQEHVRRITNEETHAHYLDYKIQNELLHLLSSSIRTELVQKVKRSKYFSIILDCTPDASHQEQMSLIIRYVDLSSSHVCIEESFLGFLDVNDTTGQGLFDVVENELKLLLILI
jgi:hypothetical protein